MGLFPPWLLHLALCTVGPAEDSDVEMQNRNPCIRRPRNGHMILWYTAGFE